MLKNVPILAFDQDQKIWSLDFSGHEIDPETKKLRNESRPDKLARFLQEYSRSKKAAVSFTCDQNPRFTVPDKQENVNQLKLQIRHKELINNNAKIQQDNLLSFLKEHMEKSINQEVRIVKTGKKILMNLDK
jgi:hypothetical protein